MCVMTPIERAINMLGLAGIARLYEPPISSQAVFKWVGGSVPAERCPDIEAATGGAVTCEALRPDVNWAVLRNVGTGRAALKEAA